VTNLKNELITNVAVMNGLSQPKIRNSVAQGIKLIKIQDSLVCPSEEEIDTEVQNRDVSFLLTRIGGNF